MSDWTFMIPEHLLREPLLQHPDGSPNLPAIFLLVEVYGRVMNPEKLAQGITWCRVYRGRYAKLFKIHKFTVTRALQFLEDRGLIRRHDRTGERRIEAEIAEKGRVLVKEGIGTPGDLVQDTPGDLGRHTGILDRVRCLGNDVGEAHKKQKKTNDAALPLPGAAPPPPVRSSPSELLGAAAPKPPPSEDGDIAQLVNRFQNFYRQALWNFNGDDSKPGHIFSEAETEAIKTFFREEEDIGVLQLSTILIYAWYLIGEQCQNKDGSIYRYGACQCSRNLLHFFKHFDQILSDVNSVVTKMYPNKGSVFDYTPVEQLVAIKYFLKKWGTPDDCIEEMFTKLFADTWQDYKSLHPPTKTSLPKQIKREQAVPEEAADNDLPPAAKTRQQGVKVEGRRAPVGLIGQEAPPDDTSDGVNLQTCLEELTRLRELYNNLPEDNPERAKALALLQHVEQVLREHGIEPPAAPPAAAQPFNPKACEDKMASLTCRMRMLDCGQEEHTKLMEEWRELSHQLDTWKAQQPKPVEKPKAGIIHQAPARRPLPRPVLAEEGYDNDQEPTAPPRRRGGRNPNQY